ncbi:unnamed protein product [Effrenium voratum]|nr:unnamed protein product [Effrenium voratum]
MTHVFLGALGKHALANVQLVLSCSVFSDLAMEKAEKMKKVTREPTMCEMLGMAGDFSHFNKADPFHVKKRGSSYRTEIRAGITTFLAMAYILPVNSGMLSIAMGGYRQQLVCATALAACIGCTLMGLLSNLPFMLAPGMGTNAFFTFTVVLTNGAPWRAALAAVFLAAWVFVVLSLTGLRTLLVRLFPHGVKNAIGAGVGLFLTFIAFQGSEGMGLTVDNPATLVGLNSLSPKNYDAAKLWLSLAELCLAGVLMVANIRGALLIGICFGTVVCWIEGAVNGVEHTHLGYPFGSLGDRSVQGFRIYLPEGFVSAPTLEGLVGTVFEGFSALSDPTTAATFWTAVFTFCYTDLLDSSGTFIAVAKVAGLSDSRGNVPAAKQNMAFLADACAGMIGSLLGVSTVGTFAESSAGVADGAKTGLAPLVTGTCFFLSVFFSPIVSAVPPLASGPVLALIGVTMMSSIKDMDWKNAEEAIPAFIAIVTMPYCFSIGYGIVAGLGCWLFFQILLAPIRLWRKESPFVRFQDCAAKNDSTLPIMAAPAQRKSTWLEMLGLAGDFSHFNKADPFNVKKVGSDYRTEIRAGLTTFLAMAYILPVNSGMLSIAMGQEFRPQLVCATALAGCIGCTLMGLLSNLPFMLAPGMGTNAFFTFTVVLTNGMPWKSALAGVFTAGLIFVFLSLTGLRTILVRLFPKGVKSAIGAGVGLFLTLIAFQGSEGMGLTVDNPATLVGLIDLSGDNYDSSKVWLSIAELCITGVLLAANIRGALLIGIMFGTVVCWIEGAARGVENSALGYPFGFAGARTSANGFRIYVPDAFASAPTLDGLAGAVFEGFDALSDPALLASFWTAVFTFCYTDLLDSSGTFIAVAKVAGLTDSRGNVPTKRQNMAFLADAASSVIGSMIGVSTVGTFAESSAGVADGAKTGLSSLVTAGCFFLSLFFSPIVSAVPPLASGPILALIGVTMMSCIKDMEWDNAEESIPAFFSIVVMPYTFSIGYGIVGGLLCWLVFQILLMPIRLIRKENPFIRFQELLNDLFSEDSGEPQPEQPKEVEGEVTA